MFFIRNVILFLAICSLFTLSLSGCNKASTISSPAEPPQKETYFIEITDYTQFHAEATLLEKAKKTLAAENLIESQSLQTTDWPIRLRLTNSLVEQMRHKGPGRTPFSSTDPVGTLLNAFCFLTWATMEVGKGAINAGTPDVVINMCLNMIDSNGTVLRIKDDIPLYTPDKKKIPEHIAREASSKIAEHIETIREGKPIENAIEETNEYALKMIQRKTS
ncbi:MAG: hypothetical protein WC124_00105 [Desulfoplanes sp.]